jgi:hypothetical protein
LFNKRMRCLCLQLSCKCFSRWRHLVPYAPQASNTCPEFHSIRIRKRIKTRSQFKTRSQQLTLHMFLILHSAQFWWRRPLLNELLVCRKTMNLGCAREQRLERGTWIATSEESTTLYSSPQMRLLLPLSNMVCKAWSLRPSSFSPLPTADSISWLSS